ncbi:dockerin type I domain-containing protein [Ruminococcus sp. JE7B6]|uniref:dockerin type I domain-containing protein n=1 Tax=Ruminococcus sp. JE7B6 TaxID=3233380 RepID=UPI00389AEC7D
MTVCKRVISVMMCVAVIIGTMISANLSAKAESGSELMPGTINDLSYEKIVNSYLSVCEGGYMRVYVDKTVYIEYYDEKLNILSKKSIEPELPMWGGFYAAKEAYYLVEGQRNSDCKNGTEVVRIIKYDKNWKRVGSGSIYSEAESYKIRRPFDAGCVNMTEQNGILYVFTSREGYIDEMYGRGHQGMMLISLNEKTMETKIVEADLNHSFTQFIDSDEKWLYLYELSEGSRATKLSRLQPETAGSYKKIPVLHYGGQRTSGWAIPTFAYADDVAVSDHSVLGVGYSIDQSMYDEADRSDNNIYNIYLTVTPKDSFTEADTKLIWLTDYKEKFNAFFNLSLAKVNDNRFMVMWEEVERIEARVERVSYDPSNPNDPFSGGKLHYLFVDSNGNKVSKEFTASASASQCKPILNDSKMIYCASVGGAVGGAVCFYTINAETGELNKKIFRVAGEQISWKMEGKTLTYSGKGALTLKPYGYLGVQKVVIRDGITEIGSGVFLNTRPYDVVIPPSVTKIADDAFDEYGPWSKRRILGYKGTYAETFANKKEDLTFVPVILGDTDLDEKVTIVDVTCIQRHLADLSTDSFGEMVADTDEDGKVTINDATAIQRHLASMPTNQNIGKPMG